ncbi:MAG: hypothetical protein UH734_03760 [Ruminococcus sp.]|nr:hypothetical protein [Ruminococcus sp.]
MKNKLFGKNITPDCNYCSNAIIENGIITCKKSKHISERKCRSFDYDPLMRVPRTITLRGTYTAEDFKL